MCCELLRAPHNHTAPSDAQYQLCRYGAAHSQGCLDPVAEIFDRVGGVLRQNLEDVAADEVGVGFGIHAKHVDDAGGEELNGQGVVAQDEVLVGGKALVLEGGDESGKEYLGVGGIKNFHLVLEVHLFDPVYQVLFHSCLVISGGRDLAMALTPEGPEEASWIFGGLDRWRGKGHVLRGVFV